MGIALLLLLAASPSARHEAEQLYKSARSDFASESYKMAFTEASRAYALVPKPTYLLEIAECQKALGHWAEAAVSYRKYLATPHAANRAAVKKSLAEVEHHLGGQSTGGGELAIAPLVSGSPPGPAGPLDASPLVAAPLAPPPPPPPPPVVATEPPPPPPAQIEPAPPAPVAAVSDTPAVSGEVASSEGGHHSHALGYTLIGVSVASAAFAVAGWVDVAGYNSYVSSVSSGQLVSSGVIARQNMSSAQIWQVVAIATTIATGLAAGGAALAW